MAASSQHHRTADSIKAARRLAADLDAGHELTTRQVPLILGEGEVCYGNALVKTFEWRAGDGEYVHRSGGWAGLAGMAIFGTINVIGNSWRRAAAGRAAAPQWRPLDEGYMFVTNRRLAIQGYVRWTDIWHSDLRMLDCEPEQLLLEIADKPRMRLDLEQPHYWFVVLRKTLYGQVGRLRELDEDDRYIKLDPSPGLTGALQPLVPASLIGKWISKDRAERWIEMSEYGRFSFGQAPGDQTSGVYRIDGPELILRTSEGLPAIYLWSIEGFDLTLTTSSDGEVSVYRQDGAPSGAERDGRTQVADDARNRDRPVYGERSPRQ